MTKHTISPEVLAHYIEWFKQCNVKWQFFVVQHETQNAYCRETASAHGVLTYPSEGNWIITAFTTKSEAVAYQKVVNKQKIIMPKNYYVAKHNKTGEIITANTQMELAQKLDCHRFNIWRHLTARKNKFVQYPVKGFSIKCFSLV